MSDRSDTPGDQRSITENAPVRTTIKGLGWIITAVMTATAAVCGTWFRIGYRIDEAMLAIKNHKEDGSVHLAQSYYPTHGQPAGSADLGLITYQIEELKKSNVELQRSMDLIKALVQERRR